MHVPSKSEGKIHCPKWSSGVYNRGHITKHNVFLLYAVIYHYITLWISPGTLYADLYYCNIVVLVYHVSWDGKTRACLIIWFSILAVSCMWVQQTTLVQTGSPTKLASTYSQHSVSFHAWFLALYNVWAATGRLQNYAKVEHVFVQETKLLMCSRLLENSHINAQQAGPFSCAHGYFEKMRVPCTANVSVDAWWWKTKTAHAQKQEGDLSHGV